MVFHRGRCPSFRFTYGGIELEIVKSFIYLGFHFTVQTTFSPHLLGQISKARSRIGQLFSSLPLMQLPISTILQIFEIYVTPLFLYGLPLWLSNCSNSAIQSLDSLFTKFIKRYLFLKPWTNNATIHFISQTSPLSNSLISRSSNMTNGLVFPPSLSGLQLKILASHKQIEPYNPVPDIPSSFWLSKIFHSLPSSPFYRKKLMKEIFDTGHLDICKNSSFHARIGDDCICISCGEHAHRFHVRFCVSS